MSQQVRQLEPKALWNHFCDVNAIPRPSKKEERIIQLMVDFGKRLNLETTVDAVGNVILRKQATAGMENRKAVVLQSHLDMVHQKNSNTIFDFDTQGINMLVDGDWVRADGTTLGADNGLGVAAIMAILSANDIPHPSIEALFTIDEETGMTGAMGLEGGILQGEILLNLDTEEDDEIDVGCAGGIDVTAKRSYREENTPAKTTAYKIAVTGLQGGHSGMDIDKGLGNANKIMNRLLFHGVQHYGLRISEIDGGGLRNAIPRESFANIVIDNISKESFVSGTNALIDTISSELHPKEPYISLEIKEIEPPKSVMDLGAQKNFIKSIYAAFNGVYKMSQEIDDLVETSNNIARVVVRDGQVQVKCLTRSSSESSKNDLADSLGSSFELAGFEVEYSGSYPGWQPHINSEILTVLTTQYERLFHEKPRIVACHAGLECGILGQNYPQMDMISFGPTIKGAHSPDEKVSISSVQKFWRFLLNILKNIPEKSTNLN